MTSDWWKQLKTQETVRLFWEMVDLRNYYVASGEVVSMTEVWEDLASTEFDETDEFKTRIKFFSGDEEHDRKAAVIAFASKITLVVSKGFWSLACNKGMLQNFLLAHEFSHIALDHHSKAAAIKHFKLDASHGTYANIPPTWEEFETNVAAVFFQCGDALLEKEKLALDIAVKFRTDAYYVGRLQKLCQSQTFRDELDKQLGQKPKRVVL